MADASTKMHMPNSNIKILVTKLVCFAEYQDLKGGGGAKTLKWVVSQFQSKQRKGYLERGKSWVVKTACCLVYFDDREVFERKVYT